MALVTLIIQDMPNGGVNVRAFCEPALSPEASEPTKAQAALVVALNAISEAAEEAAQSEPQIILPFAN